MAGTDSVLRAMETYTKQAWVLRAWQDVFVDLVQGQLQHLYVSLLSSELAPTPPVNPACTLEVSLWLRVGLPAAALHVPLRRKPPGLIEYALMTHCTALQASGSSLA